MKVKVNCSLIHKLNFQVTLAKSFFHLCLQNPKSSSLLFRVAPPGVNMMWYASVMQRRHTLVVGLNEGALVTMSQLILCWTFCSFNLQTWLDNLDAVFFPVLKSILII